MFHRFWHFTITVATLWAALQIMTPTNASAQNADLAPDDGASVIMYHRFGEDDFPSTNIRLDQIDAHIKELKNGEYTLLSLGEIVRRLKSQDGFPEKSVGVTIDDAYRSVYTEAWPRFKEAGIPFTLFVATNPVDQGLSRYMTWAQIREIAKDPLVTIGSQTASHLHMIDSAETLNRQDLEASNQRFKDELGYVPELIAYPYGEFSEDVIALSQEIGFTAGFGQHSGAFGGNDNIFTLPRFAMNENYGDVARLRTAAQSLPVPASDMTPTDTVVDPGNNPPALGFTVPEDLKRMDQMACFSNHEGKLQLERLGPRVEVRMKQALPKGRTRINCTLPAGEGRWRWFGKLLYVK